MNDSYGPCFYRLLSLFATALQMVTMEQEQELAAVRDDLIPKKKNAALRVQ
jgi:hypothetical protein